MKRLKQAYRLQKFNADKRVDKLGNPIEWQLTFDEWLIIWQNSGKLELRGKGAGRYCMSRFNDIGPYSISNVQIIPDSENTKYAMLGRKRSKENIDVMSNNGKEQNKQIVVCPHCNLSGNGRVMYRWHFDNCKHK